MEMDRLGVNYANFQAHNPGLVMASITPYGLTGPLPQLQGIRHQPGRRRRDL